MEASSWTTNEARKSLPGPGFPLILMISGSICTCPRVWNWDAKPMIINSSCRIVNTRGELDDAKKFFTASNDLLLRI